MILNQIISVLALLLKPCLVVQFDLRGSSSLAPKSEWLAVQIYSD